MPGHHCLPQSPAFAVHDVAKSGAILQVLSAVVRHFTRGMAPVSMVCKAKTPAHAWGVTSSEVPILCAAPSRHM
jgi:hypothetical protein